MKSYSKSFMFCGEGGARAIMLITTLLMIVLSISSCDSASSTTATPMFGLVPKRISSLRITTDTHKKKQYHSSSVLLELRGGASKKKKKKRSRTGSLTKTVTGKNKVGAKKEASQKSSSAGSNAADYYKQIPPLTRLYVTMIGLCSVLGLVLGEERAQAVLALDPMRFLYGMELWRPLTAAAFLGKPSVSWLMSIYYLHEYGSSLEKAYGPAEYLLFLFSMISMLTIFSMALGIPFFTQSVITGMLWVLSRAMPHAKVKWLVITVPYWSLPYGLMVTDCLQAQNASAAMPHILGILVGHFYHFHRFIWPKSGGEDWLRAPDFLVELMDPNSAKNDAAKSSINNALKKRKRGKGKKLGSA
mmetsp:Transcript_22532/g.24041  ORF Transcript_22532/g.24041 Transcript_22532/m.24041 type:complete len:359 (+) Transcript_22532:133-1209(+)